MLKIFITATDTDAGKTYAAQAIVRALVSDGQKVAVYKPISAGCDLIKSILVNNDALLLLTQSNCHQTITQVNPIAFKDPIAPHIAAAVLNKSIDIDEIQQGYKEIINLNADVVICEGAGGWRLPLGQGKFLSEFVQLSNQGVILVVNMKLGCLNHAVLSYQAIISDGLQCLGWIANCPENMPYLTENINEITQLLPVPKLAELPFDENMDNAAKRIDISRLKSLK